MSGNQFGGPSAEYTAWITERLQKGWTIEHTCQDVGLTRTQFRKWLVRGEQAMERASQSDDDRQYVNFVLQVDKARAQIEGVLIDKAVEIALQGEVKMLQFLLERMFPRDFGRFDRVELTGAEGGPIELAPAREKIEQRVKDAFARMERPKLIDVGHEDEAAAQ